MKRNPSQNEWLYAVLTLAIAIVSGLLTNLWAWSFLLWAMIYILWKWVELYHFLKWYKTGADIKQIPTNHGIWQEFASLVIHNKGKNKKIEKKNQYLLNQFNTMAQAMPYATVLLNKHFELIWANQSAQPILNIVNEEDNRKKIDKMIRAPDFIRLLSDDLKAEEIKIQHPNDLHKRIIIKLLKLSNKRYLLVARDISEQDALRQSRKAFVDNASHELRTPLTVIIGYLEMMSNADDMPKSWVLAINKAQQQSLRMEKIINDMLKLSSIENEKYMENSHELIDMPALLNRLFNDVKDSSIAKNHYFEAYIDSSLKIIGDADELTSTCLNLLNNAVIHTKNATKIYLRWFSHNHKAHLWVCDNGQGIDAKHLPHLSERFYRVDNSRDKNSNSTGLGLAIVKQICENHNAILQIHSDIKNGTCFKVEFIKASDLK